MITERLCKYMKFRELNQNKITIEAGLSVGLIGKSIKSGKGLNSETIGKILYAYPELDANWLLTGKGSMLRNDNVSVGGDNNGLINSNIDTTSDDVTINSGNTKEQEKQQQYTYDQNDILVASLQDTISIL